MMCTLKGLHFFITDLIPIICLLLTQTTQPSLQKRENHPVAFSGSIPGSLSFQNTRFEFLRGRYKAQLRNLCVSQSIFQRERIKLANRPNCGILRAAACGKMVGMGVVSM